MRLATLNAENLFDRPKAMNLADSKHTGQILDDFNTLNKLIEQQTYSQDTKQKIVKLFTKQSGYIKLNEMHGRLLSGNGKNAKVVASGRDAWIGCFELREESVKETAIENTARVIRELNADITCIVEAEDRPSLKEFNQTMLPLVKAKRFDHVMLLDGNDDRGIDVGILVKEPLKIVDIVSHVDDKDSRGVIFSRDCAEYVIETSAGEKLLVMVNHFKSQSGAKAESDEKRGRQAERVRQIYDERKKTFDLIAVLGDLNASPDTTPLQALIAGTDLVEVSSKTGFDNGGFPGTYKECTAKNKFDYILMSPKLAAKFKTGGIERHGMYIGKNGKKFAHFPEVAGTIDAASDHAGVWAEFDIAA